MHNPSEGFELFSGTKAAESPSRLRCVCPECYSLISSQDDATYCADAALKVLRYVGRLKGGKDVTLSADLHPFAPLRNKNMHTDFRASVLARLCAVCGDEVCLHFYAAQNNIAWETRDY